MYKEDVVHIYKMFYSVTKKEWNSCHCDNMDGPRCIMLNKISQESKNEQTETDSQIEKTNRCFQKGRSDGMREITKGN